MPSILNRITGLVVGQYGSPVPLTIVDNDGAVVDLSSYTGVLIRSISPDARTTLEFTGEFVTDGSDGEITFTPTTNNTFTRDGTWESQIQFSGTSILALSVVFEMEVSKKI